MYLGSSEGPEGPVCPCTAILGATKADLAGADDGGDDLAGVDDGGADFAGADDGGAAGDGAVGDDTVGDGAGGDGAAVDGAAVGSCVADLLDYCIRKH